MSGVKDDWARARAARRRAENPQVTTNDSESRDVTTSRGHDATTSGGHDATTSGSHDVTTPQRQDVATSGRHDATEQKPPAAQPAPRQRRPARQRTGPRADTAVALTVRVDPEEAPHIDALVLRLRLETGIRVDKSEVIRTLLRLAELEGPVRRALIRHIKTTHGK